MPYGQAKKISAPTMTMASSAAPVTVPPTTEAAPVEPAAVPTTEAAPVEPAAVPTTRAAAPAAPPPSVAPATAPSATHHPAHHIAGVPERQTASTESGIPWWSAVKTRPVNGDNHPSRGDGDGQFRTECEYSHMNFDDPIVFPGQPGAAHLHVYFGNTTIDAHTDVARLGSTSHPSTCSGGGANRSAYWVPAMLDAAGRPLKPERMQVYYKTGYVVGRQNIRSFPQGLRMIAGNAKSTTPQNGILSYDCARLDVVSGNGTIPNCGGGSRFVMSLSFPQCWDGVNLDSANHMSHMAYPRWGSGCPSSHPVALPHIEYRVWYDVPAGSNTAGWRLSSDTPGAPAGSSGHGDWANGWDRGINDLWRANCLNTGLDCHLDSLGAGRELCQYRYSKYNHAECR
jgi:hypothetical protein